MNRRAFLFGLGALVSASTQAAGNGRILVLYPDLPEPERTLFRTLRESFATAASAAGLTAVDYPVAATPLVTNLAPLISAQRPAAILALGRAAIAAAEQAHLSIPILAAAAEIPVPTPGLGGISLIANPRRVFSTLKEITPDIQAVSVVLQPERFAWLRPHMDQAAHALSLRLTVYEAETMARAADQYLSILTGGNPRVDSLWLLDQNNFLTPDTLPRLIEEAWARDFVVFSSVLEHVNEGALFAHYLNPRGLGVRLARLAERAGQHTTPIMLDDAPARAINLRTARHLSSIVDLRKVTDFDLILGQS